MKVRRNTWCTFGFVFSITTLIAVAQAQIPSARDVVKPTAYASFEPVARGK